MRAKHFETVLTAFSSYFTSQLPHRSAEQFFLIGTLDVITTKINNIGRISLYLPGSPDLVQRECFCHRDQARVRTTKQHFHYLSEFHKL